MQTHEYKYCAVTDLTSLLVFRDGCELHSPQPKRAYTWYTQERIADQALVKSFVVLKAVGGRGAELVEQIRELASLPAFDQGRFDQFFEDCQVTVKEHKKALRDLLRVLKKSDVELVDPGGGAVENFQRKLHWA